ncbi:MAG TPA: cysteine--tRNA ligase [Polyangiaceae bacterium]|jgi:cysteinyl-tRNA synthetase|nr:cysteine--tRNA ligase [Polyangiaceae bacterium]
MTSLPLPRLYNTLTRTTEQLTPQGERVSIYCCGPTVYDVPHAGHARAALAPDLLVRRLRGKGFDVNYVRNLTDVDDKILARAQQNGEPPLELSRRMATIYQEQMREVGCLAPDHEPKVSEHLSQIYALIHKLLENGSAYAIEPEPGRVDVYFSVRSFAEYGKLSRRKIDDLIVGARVEKDGDKQDPLDFALWKSCPQDEWGWDSPWGRGRPGWHIECSAMCSHYLGHGFDVHAGGMDLIFPHHENEVAQSEAAHPGEGPLAKLWMHNGFVNVDKEKMSKSLGNFVTVRDVLERNDAEGFRWFLLSAQYRGPLQFDTEQLPSGRVVFPGVDEAERRVDYVYGALLRLSSLASGDVTSPGKLPQELVPFRERVQKAAESADAALDDDLNTPVALAALGEMAQAANEACDLAKKKRKDPLIHGGIALFGRLALRAIGKLATDLGLLHATPEDYFERVKRRRLALRGLTAEAIEAKVNGRTEARKNKDFAAGDALRDELLALGVTLMDSPTGTEWSIAQ